MQIEADVVKLRAVADHSERLVAALAFGIEHEIGELVEVALGHVARLEEAHVVAFLRLLDAPEISMVLVRCLGRVIDDAKVEPVRALRRHAHRVVEFVTNFFRQPPRIAALGAEHPADVEDSPRPLVLAPLLIARCEVVPLVEAEFVVALAAREAPVEVTVAAVAAAQSRLDVIVDDAVVNHRALPIVGAARGKFDIAAIVSELLVAVVSLQRKHVLRPDQPVVDRHARECLFWPNMTCSIGMHRSCRGGVVGHSVVDEVGKVERVVVRIRHPRRRATEVGDCNPIAHQRAMRLRRQNGGENPIGGEHVTVVAVVKHREADPIRRVFESRIQWRIAFGVGENLRNRARRA